jgi:hypothetical protein
MISACAQRREKAKPTVFILLAGNQEVRKGLQQGLGPHGCPFGKVEPGVFGQLTMRHPEERGQELTAAGEKIRFT